MSLSTFCSKIAPSLLSPRAGGTAAVYHRWGAQISRDIEVWAVELPGHGSRFAEPAEDSVDVAVRQLNRELLEAGLIDLPFALFGHSMGGLLAFEVARSFRNSPMLKHLFASGCHAPQLDHDDPPIHELPAAEFLSVMMERYDGIPEEVLKEKDLLELVLPVLRADMKMIEGHRHQAASPFSIPITILTGKEDERVTRASLEAWRQQTTGAYELLHFPGGHFYLQQNTPEVLTRVESALL